MSTLFAVTKNRRYSYRHWHNIHKFQKGKNLSKRMAFLLNELVLCLLLVPGISFGQLNNCSIGEYHIYLFNVFIFEHVNN